MDHGIRKVGVVGAGEMGHGIAQVCAMYGFDVIVHDISLAAIGIAVMKVNNSLKKLEEKGKLIDAANMHILRDRISWTPKLEILADCDIIIESICEKAEIKASVFRELHKICPRNTIFATNTSAIPIRQIVKLVDSRRRGMNIIGMHFMNPPVLNTRLELIRSYRTSKRTYERVKAFARAIGRNPIMESQDRPGFIMNYILMPAINRAAGLVREGEKLEDVNSILIGVDKAMPILELADFIGLDVIVDISNVQRWARGYVWGPDPLLIQMVEEGKLGKKTREGFFEYDEKGRRA